MSSTPKEIIFEDEAREKLLHGVQKLAEVVAYTLGPMGRTVGLEKSWGAPAITNDGGSIVSEINLPDQYEDMGVKLGQEVASKVKELAGDGTTTGILLLRALCEGGLRHITAGGSPITIKRGIEKAASAVVKELERMAKPITSLEDTRNIACVSASGNREIGEMITEALDKGAVVTIEEGKGTEDLLEVVEGMQFDRGYLSPYFCTNNEKLVVEMASPYILLIDKKVGSIQELLPILQAVAASGKQMLIIAEDVEADALATLVVNRLRGTLKVAAVKAPGFGDRRKAMLQDLAVLTGATVISEETGLQLKEATIEMLGSAEKVVIAKDETVIVKGAGTEEAIDKRIQQIDAERKLASSSYDQEKLDERKAKLSGGVAVVRVGALTEPEMKQKKQMMEDSLSSTKAAIESGIVAGGGVALLGAAKAIDKLGLTGEEALGGLIVKSACEAPLRQLAHNAGIDGSIIIDQVSKAKEGFGLNMTTGEVEDLIKAGIIDPAKVVITALTHAASTAGVILLSEALIADAPDE